MTLGEIPVVGDPGSEGASYLGWKDGETTGRTLGGQHPAGEQRSSETHAVSGGQGRVSRSPAPGPAGTSAGPGSASSSPVQTARLPLRDSLPQRCGIVPSSNKHPRSAGTQTDGRFAPSWCPAQAPAPRGWRPAELVPPGVRQSCSRRAWGI